MPEISDDPREHSFCTRCHFREGVEAGHTKEREEIFGKTGIKGFQNAKGLLNKFVLEHIKEQARQEALEEVRLKLKAIPYSAELKDAMFFIEEALKKKEVKE